MKKFKLLFFVLLYVVNVNAQKSNVQTAVNYLKYDELDKAKSAIDAAATNDQSKGMEKTWYYRGLIYRQIYKHEKYSKLDADPLPKALEYLNKSLEINPKSEYAEDIGVRKIEIANRIFESGVDQYNSKNFAAALTSFETVLTIIPGDTSSTLNAANAAEKANNPAKAKLHYNELLAMKYNDPMVYLSLIKIYKDENDSVNCLATIKAGRQRYPTDNGLAIEEVNFQLASGKSKEALDPLNTAISKDDKNPELYFARGVIYDNLNDIEKAKADYQKAIDLKPDYFDAYFNLGALNFNEGADIINKANKIPSEKQKEYNDMKAKADGKFRASLPFFEKAYQLSPTDKNLLDLLKQVYARLGETVKYEKVKAELEKLN